MMPDKEISEENAKNIIEYAERRHSGEPLQYIFEKAHFMNMTLTVGPGVLIPRPETELLVEYVCKHAPEKARVCDIGTGSGTISLSIAHDRPDTNVVGIDLKEEALKYARINKSANNLTNVELLQSDLFSSLSGRRFDVITANLPYVSQVEYDQLLPEVHDHEPKSALYADDEGLALIKQTANKAPAHLENNGLIIFEIGYEQGPAVKEILDANPNYTDAQIIKDLNGLDRFVKATRAQRKTAIPENQT